MEERWGQGQEEEELGGLDSSSAKVLWNGREDPSDYQGDDPEACRGHLWNQNPSRHQGSDLSPPGLAVCPWAMSLNYLGLGSSLISRK